MFFASPAPGATALHGRDTELETLRRLLDGALGGAGGALLLLGAPGTGKSALLDFAAALAAELAPEPAADGFVVLRTRGVPEEERLPYAGLHALLRPVADRLPSLPPAQAAVLVEALELGTAGTGLALPAAVLNLLLAVGRPVLVCADDVHRLDAPSREALFFAARRLSGEPVALLLATGEDGGPPAGPPGGPAGACDAPGGVRGAPGGIPGDIPRLTLAGLDEEAARQLIEDLAPPELTDDLRASLAQVARGNPLALRELTGSLSPEQLNGSAPPPEAPPPGGRLWRAYADRLSRLPRDTADLLLLIAADPELDTAAFLRAAEPGHAPAALETAEPGRVLAALETAERAGLLTRLPGDRYGFREPVMRSVVYGEASLARRRAAHLLLAGLLDQDDQRLRRAWHRAAALDGPAERLADELVEELGEEPDGTAGGRSCFPEPFRAFERAAELTARGDARAARLAAAARHAWHAGLPQRARWLLARLNTLTVSEEVRGRAELVRGSLELRSGKTASACDELLAAAEWLLDRDREQAVRALIRASEASYLAGDTHRFLAITRRAAALRRPDDPPATQLMYEYLAGMAATFSGRHREAAAPLRRVLELAPCVDSPSVLVWACVSSLLLGDDVQALKLSTRAIETARAQGAVSTVPQVLEFLVQAELWMGRYASVAANAMEGLRLAQETGRLNSAAQHLGWLALTAAVEGDEETCRIRAGSAIELADAHGLGVAGALGNWALAHLDVAAGRHTSAAGRLRATARADGSGGHLVVRVMATPHFVEAAVRTGDLGHARAALAVLDRWAGSTGSPDRLALAARCHALLAGPGEAEERFREALELHRRGSCTFETARTQLLFGGVLRRNRRPGAAREHLHGALETFERHGARLWAEQARGELRASGEALPSGTPGRPRGGTRAAEAVEEAPAVRALTAQQLQIARLVADGATNREVAARLYLSPRTVEHHLRNVFARLGIRSRVELVRMLS
ncbi:helix-turn-helix transcriptional regulator [Planomonospora venezuelensis]|uniref:DNA-binding CsgD family transcriptional regulator n=1 Tax=Planomonospora venezuelensis TaxID=1999 RepID=A0A841D9D8_PLAVE|nr:AAA family ATPase [Planomonospora venezuelensis]MBB5966109.1 DNA-binding CsgD family transcriptional regulator [Planomonospora venezuelensis]GIN04643.1 helix-turn-helix transcriptional regulator [Planomonospora venezuelensis]